MPLLNVSFGIFAFLPVGWLFMGLIILLECFLASKILAHANFNSHVCKAITLSNIASGAIGIIISIILNGGWWLVCWFPWVGGHEVYLTRDSLFALSLYYICAFILSVLIETLINSGMLCKHYNWRAVTRCTLIINLFSYLLGSIILYIISFGII